MSVLLYKERQNHRRFGILRLTIIHHPEGKEIMHENIVQNPSPWAYKSEPSEIKMDVPGNQTQPEELVKLGVLIGAIRGKFLEKVHSSLRSKPFTMILTKNPPSTESMSVTRKNPSTSNWSLFPKYKN
jgi:hypothetical protein